MIDWTKPLEAYHPDGRVIDVRLVVGPDDDGDYTTTWGSGAKAWNPDGSAWNKDGSSVWAGHMWRIRNRAPSIPLATEMTLLDYFAGQALDEHGTRLNRITFERDRHLKHAIEWHSARARMEVV